MKKAICCLLVVVALLAGWMLCRKCYYPRYGKIIAVEYDYDDYIIEDAAGITWIVKGVEDLSAGDNIAMLMFNNFTPWAIYDDVVVRIA